MTHGTFLRNYHINIVTSVSVCDHNSWSDNLSEPRVDISDACSEVLIKKLSMYLHTFAGHEEGTAAPMRS